MTKEDEEFIKSNIDKKMIIFVNKTDLSNSKIELDYVNQNYIVYGNTVNNDGLDALKEKIRIMFNLNEIEASNYDFLSNVRQISLIKQASDKIKNIIDSIDNLPLDVFTIDLREAYELLGEIIGETYKDDLLDELFSKFCLGK